MEANYDFSNNNQQHSSSRIQTYNLPQNNFQSNNQSQVRTPNGVNSTELSQKNSSQNTEKENYSMLAQKHNNLLHQQSQSNLNRNASPSISMFQPVSQSQQQQLYPSSQIHQQSMSPLSQNSQFVMRPFDFRLSMQDENQCPQSHRIPPQSTKSVVMPQSRQEKKSGSKPKKSPNSKTPTSTKASQNQKSQNFQDARFSVQNYDLVQLTPQSQLKLNQPQKKGLVASKSLKAFSSVQSTDRPVSPSAASQAVGLDEQALEDKIMQVLGKCMSQLSLNKQSSQQQDEQQQQSLQPQSYLTLDQRPTQPLENSSYASEGPSKFQNNTNLQQQMSAGHSINQSSQMTSRKSQENNNNSNNNSYMSIQAKNKNYDSNHSTNYQMMPPVCIPQPQQVFDLSQQHATPPHRQTPCSQKPNANQKTTPQAKQYQTNRSIIYAKNEFQDVSCQTIDDSQTRKINQLQSQLEKEEQANEELTQQVQDLESQSYNLRQQTSSQKNQISDLQSQLSQLQSQMETVQEYATDLESQNEDQKNQLAQIQRVQQHQLYLISKSQQQANHKDCDTCIEYIKQIKRLEINQQESKMREEQLLDYVEQLQAKLQDQEEALRASQREQAQSRCANSSLRSGNGTINTVAHWQAPDQPEEQIFNSQNSQTFSHQKNNFQCKRQSLLISNGGQGRFCQEQTSQFQQQNQSQSEGLENISNCDETASQNQKMLYSHNNNLNDDTDDIDDECTEYRITTDFKYFGQQSM